MDVAVFDAERLFVFQKHFARLPLFGGKVGSLADHLLPFAVGHGATGLDVAGEGEAARAVLDAGDAEGSGEGGDPFGGPDATADSGIRLDDVVGLVCEEGREFVDVAAEFAAGDEDVDFGGEAGGTLEVHAVEGFFEPVSVVLFEATGDLEGRGVVPDPAGADGGAVEHDLERGADGGADDADGVDIVHRIGPPGADFDGGVAVVLEVDGELGLAVVGDVGLVLFAFEDGSSVDAEAVAGFAEEVGDGAAGEAADGVPHGVFDAGPALGAGLAGEHLEATHVAVDGEEVFADESRFDGAFEDVGGDGDEGCSGDAGVGVDAGDGVAVDTEGHGGAAVGDFDGKGFDGGDFDTRRGGGPGEAGGEETAEGGAAGRVGIRHGKWVGDQYIPSGYNDGVALLNEVRMDRAALSVVTTETASDARAYWQTKSMAERLEALELTRQVFNDGYDPATTRFQRILEVVESP